MKQPLVLAPSLLSANFARLGESSADVIEAGADWLHFDVMDNHFVPNLTLGAMFCQGLRDDGITAPIDVHLMVSPVERMVDNFIKAGASSITIHVEATGNVLENLAKIRGAGLQAGLAYNPETPLDGVEHYLEHIDMLLVMSVHPGFGGQSFIPASLDKLAQARSLIDQSGHAIRLEVDGGVKLDNIASIVAAGADTIVAGSAVFNSDNIAETVQNFKETA